MVDKKELQSKVKIFKAQNCQDRKIPVAKVMTCPFGVGASIDIDGNCRFYDLLRLRKMTKISSNNLRDGTDIKFVENFCKWRFFPQNAMDFTLDAFVAVTQNPKVPEVKVEEGQETPLWEKDIFVEGAYCDAKEKLKSRD